MGHSCCALLLLLLLAATATAFERPAKMCDARLGCFPMDDPWWSELRPSPAPQTPEQVATRFALFTRRKKSGEAVVPTQSLAKLKQTSFSARRRTFFVTHGFVASSKEPWVVDLTNALLEKVDGNVFVTDWAAGANGVGYHTAAANTRVVGREMARLIAYAMKETGLEAKNVHLIGHSLGAHASSYCAKEIRSIGKLTALDPAQLLFEFYNKMVRLDSGDADFVEVIHSDSKPIYPHLGFGMITDHGDVDYYINAGLYQPGCQIPDNIDFSENLWVLTKRIALYLVNCGHTRSAEVYIEAVRNTNCTFWGHPKSFWKALLGYFSRGYLHRYITPSDSDCSRTSCSPLGLDNHKFPARGAFSVPTTSSKPFCVHEPKVDAMMKQYKTQ